MQQAPTPTTVTRKQVGKLILYITPSGDLAMVAGNQHMIVSPQEAQEHVDYLLGHAALFRRHVQPVTGALVPSHNGVNA
jgi:hypothetical protein